MQVTNEPNENGSSNEYPLPVDPRQFKGELTFHYIEDSNGHQPRSSEGLVGHIALLSVVENGALVLRGRTSPYKSSCFDVRLNNHNQGMLFTVTCKNRNDLVEGEDLWRRAVDSRSLHSFFTPAFPFFASTGSAKPEDEVIIQIKGDAPDVAYCPPSTMTVKTCKRKHDYHISEVELIISLETYALFIQRFQEWGQGGLWLWQKPWSVVYRRLKKITP